MSQLGPAPYVSNSVLTRSSQAARTQKQMCDSVLSAKEANLNISLTDGDSAYGGR